MIRSYVEFGCACWFFAGLAWFLFSKSKPGRPYVRVHAVGVCDLIDEYAMDGWAATLRDIQNLPEAEEVAA